MTVAEGLAKLAASMKMSIANLIKVIAGANLLTLIKFGIIAGVAIATIILIFKFIKDRKELYKDEDEKTVVDRALEMNFADVRNQEELHPMMKKVKKNLKKELKPRKVRSNKVKAREELKSILDDIQGRTSRLNVKAKLDQFLEELPEIERFEVEVYKYPSNRTLRNVWENS